MYHFNMLNFTSVLFMFHFIVVIVFLLFTLSGTLQIHFRPCYKSKLSSPNDMYALKIHHSTMSNYYSGFVIGH